MKFRRDFVTNSSSSSFIIGKYGEGIDKNTVYELVRHIYKEFLEIKDKLMPVVSDYGICWNEQSKSFAYTKFGNLDELRDERKEINARLVADFGACLSDLSYYHNFAWIDCETYDDYLKFFEDKDSKEPFGKYLKPFDIVDFENDKVMPNGELFKDNFDYQELIEWYLPCMLFPGDDMDYDYLGNYIGDCMDCPYKKDKDLCAKVKERVKAGKISKEIMVAKLLGKIGVLSYCGFLPEYVVERLGKKSFVHCNHMG